jgi:hypothetical protein
MFLRIEAMVALGSREDQATEIFEVSAQTLAWQFLKQGFAVQVVQTIAPDTKDSVWHVEVWERHNIG